MIDIQINTLQENEEIWNEYINRHPDGNIFQTSGMYRFYNTVPRNTPAIFSAHDKSGNLCGVLLAVRQTQVDGIFSPLTARILLIGGPVTDSPDVSQLLLESCIAFFRFKAVYIQVRNMADISEVKSRFASLGFKYEEHLNIYVDITKDEEMLMKEVVSKKRNQIKKAIKEGVTVKFIELAEDVKESYAVLEEVYQRARLPLPPESYFLEAVNIFGPKGQLKIAGAFYNDILIGTMYLFIHGTTLYDWYAGAKKEFYNKNPNDLVPWYVFNWGRENGYKKFDWMGAGKPDEKYGVRDYKIQFGGELVNPGRFEFEYYSWLMKAAKIGFNLWRKVTFK